MKNKSIFEKVKLLPLFGCIAALSWGFAVPLIKIGIKQFQITSDNTGGKIIFAGIRFTIAGLMILLLHFLLTRMKTKEPAQAGAEIRRLSAKEIGMLILFAFVNTAAMYFCFYIGVSNSPGSRSAILNSLNTFFLVILASLVFREKVTRAKIIGCLLGLTGILILNLGGEGGGAFTLAGDGMMILSSICSAFGGVLTRIVCRRVEPVFATGSSLVIGGLMLTLCGILMRGTIPAVNVKGTLVLLFLAAISVTAFTIYNQLLVYHPVGKVAIFNALIPVFGVALSCILLGEVFLPRYILAAFLVATGVFVINRK